MIRKELASFMTGSYPGLVAFEAPAQREDQYSNGYDQVHDIIHDATFRKVDQPIGKRVRLSIANETSQIHRVDDKEGG